MNAVIALCDVNIRRFIHAFRPRRGEVMEDRLCHGQQPNQPGIIAICVLKRRAAGQ